MFQAWPNHTFNRTLRGVPSLGQNSSPNLAHRKVPVNFYVRPHTRQFRAHLKVITANFLHCHPTKKENLQSWDSKQIATAAAPSLCLHFEKLMDATFAMHAQAIQRGSQNTTAMLATTLRQTQTRREAH